MTATLRLLLLDLDGTLIESLAVKDAAFARLYADQPELDAILDYHRNHNHVIRFDKFRHISERFLGKPLAADEDRRLRKVFTGFVVDELISCPEIPGARNLLDTYWNSVPMVLISRSPDGELRYVLAARKLDRYFVDVYSADWSKQDAIIDAVCKNKVRRAEAVYIGDSPEDAAAAKAAGVAFVGRRSSRNLSELQDPVFDDLTGVRTHLATAFKAC